jgi:hypothetical protein
MSAWVRLGATLLWLGAAAGSALAQGQPPVQALPPAKAPSQVPGPAAAAVQAQSDETVSVAVQVTDSSGESIFLDKGRDAGIDVGQRVLLYSRTHGILTGTIRGVSRNSSNCTLDAGVLAVEFGTRAEVLVPKRSLLTETPGPENRPSRPEHPPWSTSPPDWNNDSPLLLPAFSRSASERPSEVTGYTFLRGSYSNNQFGTNNQYVQGEAGLDATLLNSIPWGGVLRLRAEYMYQADMLSNAPSTHENDARVDWFSCVWGDLRKSSLRAEVGRFLQHEFSELGVIDGGECTTKIGDSWHVGASLGAMPDYRHGLYLTGDYQGAAFGKFVSGTREEFSLGVAYQKTLHDGVWDRDLIVAVAEYVPSSSFSARASVWMDYYTAHELVKPPGIELTEAHAYASYRFDVDNNLGVFFTRSRQPDTLRNELLPPGQTPTPQVAELLLENLSLYYGAYSWHRLSQRMTLDTRVNLWSDQTQQSGVSGEVHVAFQDVLFDKGELGFSAFYTDGIYSKGPGARVTVSHLFAPVSVLGWYEAAWYENTMTLVAALQNSIHLSVDAAASETWTFSLSADYRFGYQQASATFLISIMKRIR